MTRFYENWHEPEQNYGRVAKQDYCDSCKIAISQGHTQCLDTALNQVRIEPDKSSTPVTLESHVKRNSTHTWTWEQVDLNNIRYSMIHELD